MVSALTEALSAAEVIGGVKWRWELMCPLPELPEQGRPRWAVVGISPGCLQCPLHILGLLGLPTTLRCSHRLWTSLEQESGDYLGVCLPPPPKSEPQETCSLPCPFGHLIAGPRASGFGGMGSGGVQCLMSEGFIWSAFH